MPETNEMTIDLPMSVPVPPMAPPIEFTMDNGYADAAAGVMSSGGQPEDAIAIGDIAEVAVSNDATKISVYADSIKPVSYSDGDTLACFDVVFSVGINVDGSSKTYQVVKRIGIDKLKIAAQAQNNQPVSVVESTPAPEAKKPVTESISHAKRMRTLAGLE